MITLETLVPESLMPAANQLAACKGQSLADLDTYLRPTHQDTVGNKWSWCGVQVSEEWLGGIATPPTRPDFDIEGVLDLALAGKALASVTILQALPASDAPFAMPTGMVVFVGTGLPQALGLMRTPDHE